MTCSVSNVSIVDFEQVNVIWVRAYKIKLHENVLHIFLRFWEVFY